MAKSNGFYENLRDTHEFYNCGKNFAYTHYHKAIEVIYVFKGTLKVKLNETKYVLREHQMIFIPPYWMHAIEINNKAQSQLNTFPAALSDDYLKVLSNRIPKSFILRDEAFATKLATDLRRVVKTPSLYSRNAIYQLCLAEILENISTDTVPSEIKPSIYFSVVNYINEHCTEDLTLDELSRQFHYSRSYFSVLFNRFFQLNLKSFINHARIRRAVEMLKKMSITEVAFAVGYTNLQSFFYNFNQIMGCTPKTYQLSIMNKE